MPANNTRSIKVFQYPTHRGGRAERWNPVIEKPPKKPKEEMGLVQGKLPRSIEEWRVAVALWRWKVTFDYQVIIRGGSMVRGGQILDFLLYVPFSLPVQVFGEYWHRAQLRDKDRFKLAILQQIYGIEPVVLWGNELQSQEDTNQRVRELI